MQLKKDTIASIQESKINLVIFFQYNEKKAKQEFKIGDSSLKEVKLCSI